MSAPKPGSDGRALSSRQRIWIRLVCAPLLLAIVIGLLLLHRSTGNPVSTYLLLTVMAAVGGVELVLLLRHAESGLSRLHAAVVCGLLCAVGLFAPADFALRMELRVGFLVLGLLWLLGSQLLDVRPAALSRIALGCVPMLYVGLLFSSMVEISSGAEGAMRCLFVVVVAKCSDMGGWLIGRPFGKHKMVPSVSPGKSWEGTAGGVAMSVLAACFLPEILGLSVESAYGMPLRIGFGVLVAATSILAGVTQSGWKRRVGAKDSSSLIPEMGGVLDMIDSLLFAGPAAYLWYRLLA